MKTNTKNTLKKLGLGASAFACLMSMGVNISAATEKTTTVTYDNRSYGGGENGSGGVASWGVFVPAQITLSTDPTGVQNTIQIVSTSDYKSDSLSNDYSVLEVKAQVASTKGYVLQGQSGNTANYTLKVENQTFDSTTGTSAQIITQKLGVGTDTATSLSLTSTLINPSSVVEDQYSDTLTFSFTEENATTKP